MPLTKIQSLGITDGTIVNADINASAAIAGTKLTGVNDAKAWVNFNGTGTVAIRASFNISSITDDDTGVYFINFTNALTDVNYATANSNPTGLLATGNQQFAYSQVTIVSTSRCDLNLRLVDNDAPSFTQADSADCCVVVFR